mmetsp:Transcript_62458/g.182563  ORF Transcript_62458/g.182563 Transcript_62458/m.182563 type:complete len:228 (+) Transcript_62458:365-1048(+)
MRSRRRPRCTLCQTLATTLPRQPASAGDGGLEELRGAQSHPAGGGGPRLPSVLRREGSGNAPASHRALARRCPLGCGHLSGQPWGCALGALRPQPGAQAAGGGRDQGLCSLPARRGGQALSAPLGPRSAFAGLRQQQTAARRPGADHLAVPGAGRAEPLPRAGPDGGPLRGGPRGRGGGRGRHQHAARLRAAAGGARLLRRAHGGRAACGEVPERPPRAVCSAFTPH